jgi:Mg-chelatase subunit ChlD
MALSTEQQVLLDQLLEKQRQDKIDNPKKYQRSNKKLYVFKVLDASSSMSSYTDTTISTFNESLDALKEAEAEVHVTRIDFASSASVKKRGSFNEGNHRLDRSNYRASGNTAMYDGIGLAFEEADRLESDSNTSFLLEILTDGEENISSRWTIHQLKREIEARKRTGQWTVTVMGPKGSIDLFKSMGVEVGNIAQFNANSAQSRGGVTRMMASSAQGYVKSLNASIGSVSVNSAYSSVAGTGGGAADVDSWLTNAQSSGIGGA